MKPIAFHSLDPAPTTAPADPTGTATEVSVRTLNTPAPAAAPTTTEPKPQPAPIVTTTATTNSAVAPPASERSTGPAPSSPNGPVEITCREERLDITTDWHIVGTAKLRKYVTSEQVERRVPVVRERVRVERMPVSEAERASLTEKEIAEAVEEVTLREERPVVRKYLTPIERVRLVVERYTAEEVIRDELRREHVEIHDNTAAAPATPVATPAAEAPRPAVLRPFA
ncbi:MULTISPECIES: YsnF/AvaK domain-containing protein [unclassified Kitasatospora]|uniref:YsnF/AvaK domain-containing protein n=1 Tax=unclassified Kitasatospora TaxID=2633591 RepID=UPI003812F0A8